jgi:hypothetical protein
MSTDVSSSATHSLFVCFEKNVDFLQYIVAHTDYPRIIVNGDCEWKRRSFMGKVQKRGFQNHAGYFLLSEMIKYKNKSSFQFHTVCVSNFSRTELFATTDGWCRSDTKNSSSITTLIELFLNFPEHSETHKHVHNSNWSHLTNVVIIYLTGSL